MSEVDGVKAINKVTFGQRLKAYKRSKLSFLLAVLVLLSAIITIGVLGYLIFYILIKGVPNLSPDLFSLTYTSENVSMIPAIINTLIMTILALLIAVPLGIFSAIYMVEYAKKGNKLVGVVSVTTETLAGIPSIVYGLFGMLFFCYLLPLEIFYTGRCIYSLHYDSAFYYAYDAGSPFVSAGFIP